MTIFNVIFLAVVTIVVAFIVGHNTKKRFDKKKGSITKQLADSKLIRQNNRIVFREFFWANEFPTQFIWISIGLIFFTLLGVAIGTVTSLIFSFFVLLGALAFFYWARESYINLPKIVAERLKTFEEEVRAAIDKEITFEGDNIQTFSNKDDEFDTKPQIFEFPVEAEKNAIRYPILQEDPKKWTIVTKRKLEFLILSREYFSVCQGAAKFDFFTHRGDIKKKFAFKKGAGGECNEYYYSQMRNVQYDAKEKGIRIIYNHDEPDTIIKCKKDPKVMKAIREKLRLTERQRLEKIQEHKFYEDIKDKRKENKKEEKEESA